MEMLQKYLGRWRKEKRNTILSMSRNAGRNAQPEGHFSETSNSIVFSYEDLKIATRDFRGEEVSEERFGKVFKGWLNEKTCLPSNVGTGMMITVKKWNPNSFQGLIEWQTEVDLLGRLSHPNIVKLLGHCAEKKELLLVYEFIHKGSLADHLFRSGGKETEAVLFWDNRLKIAIGAAHALSFLHSLQKPIILRDLKASNILLDEKLNAKLTGFGLAMLGPSDGESYIETQVMGTYGYAAPEYVATGRLYVKSDVFSFGVILLELLTGLNVIDNSRLKKRNLIDWAKPLLPHKRKMETLVDVKIKGQYSTKEALDIAKITQKCLVPNPQDRPSMKELVDALEQIQAIKENPKETELSTTKSTPSS